MIYLSLTILFERGHVNKKFILIISLFILCAPQVFGKDIVLNCEFKIFNKNSGKREFTQLTNRLYLVTIVNNKFIYLNNITKNLNDKSPFYILENNNNYLYAIANFSKKLEGKDPWIETIVYRKRDEFMTITHSSKFGNTVKDGYCKIN